MKVKHLGCGCYMEHDKSNDLDGYFICPNCNSEVIIE